MTSRLARPAITRIVALLLALLAVQVAAAGPAVAQAETSPDPSQVARCMAAPAQFILWCLRGYRAPALRLPTELRELGLFSITGTMAIFRPAGAGPFPAIVLLHTCGGIEAQQMRYWARAALDAGYAAFILDSFSQRGYPGGHCDNSPGSGSYRMGVRDIYPVRARDAHDALVHLARCPESDGTRVAAMGLSQGGRVAYLLANPTVAAMYAHDRRRFRAIVSVYGECYNRLLQFRFVRPPLVTPLLALQGDNDTDGDVTQCLPGLQAARAQGGPVEWHVFPGAAHAWDQPNFQPGRYSSYAGSLTGQVLMQYDASVTEASRTRALAFIARHLGR